MQGSTNTQRWPLRSVLVAVGTLVLAAGAFAASPVTVKVAVTGTPTPGATVTAKATVTISDGSTQQSISWTQTGGPTATLSNTNTDTITAVLPTRQACKDELVHVLNEPPSASADPDDFFGGLQNRFEVLGTSPRALEEAGAVALDVVVVTTSGTYHNAASIAVTLPWTPATGLKNVAVLVPVVLHGKTQATYNWTLTGPTGSTAAMFDAATQNPEFTPDVPGTYQVTVTDLTATPNATVTLPITAGTWKGVITGQDADGRPVADVNCRTCHAANTPLDKFTPWAHSGHSEIFTQNVDTPYSASYHYSGACLSCHTVGYNTTAGVANNGFDDQPDYSALMASGLVTHGGTDNWTQILAQYPASAREANIQCENCHGPQDTPAHPALNGSREGLSSDVCGTCHGEPARHGRFQQWQISGHANYQTAMAEGTNPSCAKCHSAQGFLQWEDSGWVANPTIKVTWNADTVEPQTCQTCHDPHAEGTTSSSVPNNATVRIMGTTPMLDAGFKATGVGRGAICMTCHNGRRGLRDDQHFTVAGAAQAPHVGPQADIIMGQNLYFTSVGTPGYHSMISDACVNCHMEKTPPPSDLSLPGVGTNHAFAASKEICSKCHSEITADEVQAKVEGKMASLKTQIEAALKNTMQAQLKQGKSIDLGGVATLHAPSDFTAVEFVEVHGAQGMNVALANGSSVQGVAMTAVKVIPPGGTGVALYSVADPAIPKAGWNYFMVESDASKGVHNPAFINSGLDVALFAVQALNKMPLVDPSTGGGPGTGVGAVSCTTPYVYWAEIVAHQAGSAGSQWRTDLVARNLASDSASLRFVLHQQGGNSEGTGTVPGGAQKGFEDVVATLGGGDAKGSLEVCSNQPLLVLGRTYNQATAGTFGQFIDGHVANLGMGAGETASLIGLRQKTDEFRTNLSVTNGGTTDAQVAITLYDTNGTSVGNFNLTVPSGKVTQEQEPFKNRANKPDLGWGFASVTVLSGSNVLTSASVIDMKTNDPITVPGKQ
jgi:hypothetical protein